jgi:hypothetical protein
VHSFPEQRQFEILMKTPKAFANSSPGLERQRQPWEQIIIIQINPEKGFSQGEPFSGLLRIEANDPRVLTPFEPWAEISERLRRNFKLMLYQFSSPVDNPRHDT